MKVGLIADIHINTKDDQLWESDRLSQLAIIINNIDIKELWIIGDLIDLSKPTVTDIVTCHKFLSSIKVPIKYIDGNHERANKQHYILEPLMTMWGYEKLPLEFTIEGNKIVAVGHSDLDYLHTGVVGDLLLSHFRWSHTLYGDGEVKKIESSLISRFTSIILGDIHYKYTPYKNVKYISSPYSIKFSTTQDNAMMVLDITKKGINSEYVDLDLPNKVKLTTSFGKLHKLLDTLSDTNKYSIDVKIVDKKELNKFKMVHLPNNVVSLRPILAKTTKVEEPTKLKDTVIDTLLNVLPKSVSNDHEYIRRTLED